MAGGDLCRASESLSLWWLAEARSCQGEHMRIHQAVVSSSACQSLGQLIGWLVCWWFGRVETPQGKQSRVSAGNYIFYYSFNYQLFFCTRVLVLLTPYRWNHINYSAQILNVHNWTITEPFTVKGQLLQKMCHYVSNFRVLNANQKYSVNAHPPCLNSHVKLVLYIIR